MARLNIEAYIVAHLASRLDGVTVRTRVPDPRPARLVVVQRAGGRRLDSLRDRPGVHLLIYGGSEWETSELASEVADAMWALNRSDRAMLDGIDRVDEEALRSDPDTQTDPDTPRWFASYTVTTHRYPT
jgi:hypothetical protein